MHKFWLLFLLLFTGVFASGPVDAAKKQAPSDKQLEIQLNKLEEDVKKIRKTIATNRKNPENVSEEPPEHTQGQGYVKAITRVIEQTSDQLRKGATEIMSDIIRTGESLAHLPIVAQEVLIQLESSDTQIAAAYFLLKIASALLIAFAVRCGLQYLIRKLNIILPPLAGNPPLRRIIIHLGNIGILLVPEIVFAATFYSTFNLIEPNEEARIVVSLLNVAIFLTRVVIILLRMLLNPLASDHRLLPISEYAAEVTYGWLTNLVKIIILGRFGLEIGAQLGLPSSSQHTLLSVMGLVTTVMTLTFIIKQRHHFRNWLTSESTTEKLRAYHAHHFIGKLAPVWHIAAISFVGFTYLVWLTSSGSAFHIFFIKALLTYLTFSLSRFLDDNINIIRPWLSKKLITPSSKIAQNLENNSGSFDFTMRVLAYGLPLLGLAELWDISIIDWLFSDDGQTFTGRATTVGITILIAGFLQKIGNNIVARYLADQKGNKRDRSVNARMRTVAALFRVILRVVIWIPTLLVILAELDFEIGHILAGFGVLGLGVGLGAQDLAKDLFTGIFMLVENTIAIGDTIAIDGRTGEVEAMTLRTIRMRDDDGTVHTIPYSKVNAVSNLTREYAYAMINVSVNYDEDLEQVFAAIREVGDEIRQDPEWAKPILAPLELRGVDKLGEHALEVQLRMKTVAGKQAPLRRELRRRIKLKFDVYGFDHHSPQLLILAKDDKKALSIPQEA